MQECLTFAGKPYAFVHFRDASAAEAAVRALHRRLVRCRAGLGSRRVEDSRGPPAGAVPWGCPARQEFCCMLQAGHPSCALAVLCCAGAAAKPQ